MGNPSVLATATLIWTFGVGAQELPSAPPSATEQARPADSAAPADLQASPPDSGTSGLAPGVEPKAEAWAPGTADVPPDPSAAPDPPAISFAIEAILVEGTKHGSAKIVAAETLLTAGSSYTEAQLQQALHRVERLPFVVSADFALRKGSERGRYILAIAVVETWPLFAGGTVDLSWQRSSYGGQTRTFFSADGAPQIGARTFFRGTSEIRATFSGRVYDIFDHIHWSGSVARLEYTRHNLAGGRLLASVGVEEDRRIGDATTIDGRVAWALSRTHVVTARADWRRSSNSEEFVLGGEVLSFRFHDEGSHGGVSLEWQGDTTDDPFVPRRGRRYGASTAYSQGHAEGGHERPPDAPAHYVTEREWLGATIGYTQYWSLSRRVSLGVSSEGRVSRSDGYDTLTQEGSTSTAPNGGRGVTGKVDLHALGALGRLAGSSRWWCELGGTLQWDYWERDSQPLASNGRTFIGIRAALAARGRWGMARLTIAWGDFPLIPLTDLR